jgi:glycosyltransferase involved in cell wall biosynthesis
MAQVGVIIPTFNRGQKVARAVSSVLFQTFRDFEVIVVDDGSKDDTQSVLAPLRSHIKIISHPENLGVSAARNTGIKATSAPLIAFLDSDDYWLPEKLSVQVRFFREHPEVVACQTEERWIRRGLRANPKKKHLKPSGDIFEASLKLCLVSPSAAMIRRCVLDEIGLFDETLPVCEDYDLWLRISSLYPIHLIEQTFVVKEGGSPDQLSRKYKGMDRYRIKAMLKLVENGQLNERQLLLVAKELAEKCAIYGKGCLRRGRQEEGEYYLHLLERMNVATQDAAPGSRSG